MMKKKDNKVNFLLMYATVGITLLIVVIISAITLERIINPNRLRSNATLERKIYIDRVTSHQKDIEVTDDHFVPNFSNVYALNTMEEIEKYLYSIDPTASYLTLESFDVKDFILQDLRIDLKTKAPKVLIFHTHSQEAFIDSEEGVKDDTIVGVGKKLAEILAKSYNIPVVHDIGEYDVVNGRHTIIGSYEVMEPSIRKVLKKYPSIEVIIDLHRDGVPDDVHFVTEIDGKSTAKLMFFNGTATGLRSEAENGTYKLHNEYVKDNLALSLQMQLMANELYPGLARKIYIRPYRYSLHLKPRSMLVEVGGNTNTVEEAKNAMYPLAKLIVEVLDIQD